MTWSHVSEGKVLLVGRQLLWLLQTEQGTSTVLCAGFGASFLQLDGHHQPGFPQFEYEEGRDNEDSRYADSSDADRRDDGHVFSARVVAVLRVWDRFGVDVRYLYVVCLSRTYHVDYRAIIGRLGGCRTGEC